MSSKIIWVGYLCFVFLSYTECFTIKNRINLIPKLRNRIILYAENSLVKLSNAKSPAKLTEKPTIVVRKSEKEKSVESKVDVWKRSDTKVAVASKSNAQMVEKSPDAKSVMKSEETKVARKTDIAEMQALAARMENSLKLSKPVYKNQIVTKPEAPLIDKKKLREGKK